MGHPALRHEEGDIKVNPDGTMPVAWWLRGEKAAWRPRMHNTFTGLDA
jgi:hypothetical protein